MTKPQLRVLRLMAEGWELGEDLVGFFRINTRATVIRDLHRKTINGLLTRGFIEKLEDRIPIIYTLTPSGEKAAKE